MQQSAAIAILSLASGALCGLLAGCNGPHPFVREGDANSVEIFYSGNVATALPVAREHCARYERVPQYVDAAVGLASFKCVPK